LVAGKYEEVKGPREVKNARSPSGHFFATAPKPLHSCAGDGLGKFVGKGAEASLSIMVLLSKRAKLRQVFLRFLRSVCPAKIYLIEKSANRKCGTADAAIKPRKSSIGAPLGPVPDVPAPETLMLVSIGLIDLAWRRWRS
jgi:hypothetical protein